VLPLVPGYLSYVTGLAGADLDAQPRRGRVAAGVGLFIAGFSVVFILTAVLISRVGQALFKHQRAAEIGAGILIIVMGLAFAGLVPGLQREFRVRRLPAAGLVGAPVFGAVFALSWTPCLGPTLGAVLGLAAAEGTTARAVVLAVAYCVGLGLPFLAFGLGLRRLFGVVKRHVRWVSRIGGALLVLTGLALVTGLWGEFTGWLRGSIAAFEVLV
jgi:cytochrome c-type biogenesis protein